MYSPSLRLLSSLLARAAFRNLLVQLKTPSGAALSLILVGTLAVGVGPAIFASIFSPMSSTPLSQVFTLAAPAMLFATMTLAVLSDAGKTLLELRPPELQFVLAGPFTDSQILTYRLGSTLAGLLPVTLVAPLVLGTYFKSFIGGFVGFGLAVIFVVLLTFLYSLAKSSVLSSGTDQAIRLLLLLGTFAVPAEMLARMDFSKAVDFETIVGMLDNTISLSIVGMLFRPFTNLVFEPLSPFSVLWLTLSLALVSLVLSGCYRLNGGFAEMAVEGIARRKKKLQRAKSGHLTALPSSESKFRRSVPTLGWFGGFGPVAWNQLTILIRRGGRNLPWLIGMGLIAAIGLAAFIASSGNPLDEAMRANVVPIALCVGTYLAFLITIQSSLGFTVDDRTLVNFQLLPVRPFPVSLAMLTGLVTLQFGTLVAVFLPACVVTSLPWHANLAVFLAALSVNLAIASILNLLCMWTDLRPLGSATPDVFQAMRAMVFVLLVAVGILPSIASGALAAVISGAVLGFDWTICAAGACLGVTCVQPVVWWLTAIRWATREG